MAGTLFGLGLSQHLDLNGRPLVGCKLYIYAGDSLVPVTAYRNTGLTLPHPWPIVADARGRIPSFWLEDGTYRARLTDASGVVQFDETGILALGPSSGEGGGGDTVDPNAIAKVGDVKWRPLDETEDGWVRLNGRTIGSATSGATERANSDCEALYLHYWAKYSNTYAPVTGGRGATAAEDWAANKPLALLDFRNRAALGLSDMGTTSTAGLTGVPFTLGDENTAAARGGEARNTLVASQMPTHTHPAVVTDPGHRHFLFANETSGGTNVQPDANNQAQVGHSYGHDFNYTMAGTATEPTVAKSSLATTGITVANTNAGEGAAHNNMPPFVLGTFYQKL